MYGKYTIAVCDILGFSKLVESTRLDWLVEQVLPRFRQSLQHSLHKESFPQNVPTLSEIDTHQRVGVAWFSDTILLYTREDSDDCMRDLLGTVAWLLFERMFEGARVRAGIAYGDAFIDPTNSLYVGQPIVEAYQLEKRQAWSGAALAESAVERIPVNARTGYFADWWIVPYQVPLKAGGLQTLAVNWTQGIHRPDLLLRWSKDSEEPTDNDWKTQKDVCEKWQNTKTFHDGICRTCHRQLSGD